MSSTFSTLFDALPLELKESIFIKTNFTQQRALAASNKWLYNLMPKTKSLKPIITKHTSSLVGFLFDCIGFFDFPNPTQPDQYITFLEKTSDIEDHIDYILTMTQQIVLDVRVDRNEEDLDEFISQCRSTFSGIAHDIADDLNGPTSVIYHDNTYVVQNESIMSFSKPVVTLMVSWRDDDATPKDPILVMTLLLQGS